jgi:3-oxoadipate enol-lactonase
MVQTVRLNGNDVAYRFDGPAGAPVVMFGNSLGADMSMWDDNLDGFTRNYRTLRYDVRGHGGTAALPAPYSMADLVEDAVALLDALRIAKVHFVGLSLGGMFGQLFGASHPERLLSLTLCDCASEHTARDAWQTRIDMVRAGGVAAITEATLQRWFTPEMPARAPQTVERVRNMILGTSTEGYVGCASAVRDLNHTGLLHKITVPTLVLVGEHDMGATVAQARIIEQNIRGAALVILENAAHVPNIERPAAFNQAVLAFLDSVGAASPS